MKIVDNGINHDKYHTLKVMVMLMVRALLYIIKYLLHISIGTYACPPEIDTIKDLGAKKEISTYRIPL